MKKHIRSMVCPVWISDECIPVWWNVMIQLDKTGVVDICHAMVACDNQVYLKWVIKLQWKFINVDSWVAPNNFTSGTSKELLHLTIYITYPKHLLKDILFIIEKIQYHKWRAKQYVFHLSATCIFQPTIPSFIRVNGCYKHHTPFPAWGRSGVIEKTI